MPTGFSILSTGSSNRVTVLQGQVRVSGASLMEFSTILGSCVATCLFDPEAAVGGMNHFLLAEPPPNHPGEEVDVHYGVYLMELLINEMLANGASKARMRAHLYGGASLRAGMMPIGPANAKFALGFLEREGIPLVRSDLGSTCARRVDFRPGLGKVRCRIVENSFAPEPAAAPRREAEGGDIELF